MTTSYMKPMYKVNGVIMKNRTLLKLNHSTVTHSDCTISVAVSDDGYCDYSIMVLIESQNKKRLFNRLVIEDY
jgi:hypothetical protein